MRITHLVARPTSSQPSAPRFRASHGIAAAMVALALSVSAALADDRGAGVNLVYGDATRSVSRDDSFSLSPPPFPLDSPLLERRFLRSALHECAYRQLGNNGFDYPATGPTLSDPGPALDVQLSPPPPVTVSPPVPSSAPPTVPPYVPPYVPPAARVTTLPSATLEAVSPSPSAQAAGLNFYARVDYFYWRESYDTYRLLDESGPLVTLGLMTQREGSRLRTEIFGGQVNYDGETMDGDPLKLNTDYLGCRIQYDLLCPFQHDPNSAFVLGLGTRLWDRKLRDGYTQAGDPVTGYDELWWMLYPTVGVETRRPMSPTSHWFASASLGVTGFTYERIGAFDVTLYPKMGPLVQVECGIQTPRLFLSVFFEVMQWYASNMQGPDLMYQPDSMRLTAGLNAGLHF